MRFVLILSLLYLSALSGCASKFLELEDPKQFETNEEYDQLLVVEEVTATPVKSKPEVPQKPKPKAPKTKPKTSSQSQPPASDGAGTQAPQPEQKELKKSPSPEAHAPKAEKQSKDSGMFVPVGQRPQNDPFQPGESSTLVISYLNIEAGTAEFSFPGFKEVNGDKAYHFVTRLKTSSLFSAFYKVNNLAETYVDYQTLNPYNLEVHIKESGLLRETRSFFDRKTQKARYWEKKVRKGKDPREKKAEWSMDENAQNVISSLFFMRMIDYKVGEEFSFPVADSGKNIVVTGSVLALEMIETKSGERLEAFKIKPQFEVDGLLKPVGDIYIWISNDERKLLAQIEMEIRIGSFIARLKNYSPGRSVASVKNESVEISEDSMQPPDVKW